MSAVCGKKEVFQVLEEGKAAFGGTFNGNPMSLAAVRATLSVLSADGGKPLEDANKRGLALRDGIREIAGRLGVPLQVHGFGCAIAVHFTEHVGPMVEYRDTLHNNPERLRTFLKLALDEGVNVLADGRFYTSVVHTDREIEQTLAAVERALQKM
jgi:glutamate-1-semialdehyde 2,1-aminomutase